MEASISPSRHLYSIYKLIDPRDKSVHYVGMSRQPYQRYGQHLTLADTNVAKNTWLVEMTAQGYLPHMEIIEQVEGFEKAKKREAHWIRVYLGLGRPLANVQQGSDRADIVAETNTALSRISQALQGLQETSNQLQERLSTLQEEIASLKAQQERQVSVISRTYTKVADMALKRRKKSARLKPTIEEKITHHLQRLQDNPPSVRDLSRWVHVDTATVREQLEPLLASGKVEQVQVGKSIRYRYVAG